MNFDDKIFEEQIDLNNGKKLNIAILIGGFKSENPQQYMDNLVSRYVGSNGYNEYIDSNLDVPWIRIIIDDLNDIPENKYKTFRNQTLAELVNNEK